MFVCSEALLATLDSSIIPKTIPSSLAYLGWRDVIVDEIKGLVITTHGNLFLFHQKTKLLAANGSILSK